MVRGRPEKLTDNLKREIARIWINHPKWRLAEIREELRLVLTKDIKKEQPAWSDKQVNLEVTERLPGISRIQKFMKKDLKPNEDKPETQNLELPWHLGTLEDYPLLAEAIPLIFLVQEWLEHYPDNFNNPPPQRPLTIRQAIWISRLYTVIDSDKIKKEKYRPSIARYLFLWAQAYATRQAICDISATTFNTSDFDKPFRQMRGYPVTVDDKTTIVFNMDRTFSIDTVDEKLLRQIKDLREEGEK